MTLARLIAQDGLFADGDWVESKDQDPAGAVRLLQLADIGDGAFLGKSHRFISDAKFEQLRCTEVIEHDVLIARMPAPLGRACLAPRLNQRCITVVDVAIVRPGSSSVAPKWLMYFVNAPAVRQSIDQQSSGTTRRRISRSKLAQLQLPVPPLAEQKRIVDKLDALLCRLDACRDHLGAVPAILKRFRQSVLSAATTGELTQEWREERGLTSEWTIATVADIAALTFDGPFGSSLMSKDYVDAGIRVVRLENIAPLRFADDKRAFISAAKYAALERHTLLAGDILFSSFVDEEVRVCLLPDHLAGEAINKADCFCIRADQRRCMPEYLVLALACKSTFEGLDEVIHGATRPRINLTQLRNIRFLLPTPEEQKEVVARCQTLLDLADTLERRLTNGRSLAESLASSILAKAFRGELVPQDPGDEPSLQSLAKMPSGISSTTSTKSSSLKSPSTTPSKEIALVTKRLVEVLAETGGWITAQDAFRGAGIADGSTTEAIEGVYAELRELERSGRVALEAVRDERGRKLYDRLKLVARD